MQVKFKRLSPYAKAPEKAYQDDSCFDLFALESYSIPPYEVKLIKTGIALEIPKGYEGQVRGRSGLGKQGIFVFLGTIDAGYRGDIGIVVFNTTPEYFRCSRGTKLAQLAIKPVLDVKLIEADDLEESERGSKGFGSTGV